LNVGPGPTQQLGRSNLVLLRSEVERSPSIFVRQVNIRPGVDQRLDVVGAPLNRGVM